MQNTNKKSVLKNGLTVVSDHMPDVESISMEIWVKVGSRYESIEQLGLSHFLEHMAFKGTKKRTAKQIAEEFDAIGGYLNAYTTREFTVYATKFLKEHLEFAIEILSDILLNSSFMEQEIERERKVILQEIAQNRDDYDELAFDFFSETAYRDQAIGRNILGTEESIQKFQREDFINYTNQHYQGSSMVLSAVGKIDHEVLVKLSEQYFATLGGKRASESEQANYTGGIKILDKKIEQVHLVIGFQGSAYLSDGFYISEFFSSILGSGMSSRLFQEIREKRGMAYAISTFTNTYHDTGVFGVFVGTSSDKVEELIKLIGQEIEKMSASVDDFEMAKTMAQIKSNLLMSRESADFRSSILANNYSCHGRAISSQELIDNFQKVTKEDLYQFAKKLLENSSNMTLSMIGKSEGVKVPSTLI